jgi:oligopeptide/dipeptide ABC transporter ATP-binding protein
MTDLLTVEGLETQFRTREGIVHAVNGVSFSLREGETLGIVGESGCGKSVTVMSMLRLIPSPPGKVVAGKAIYQGKDLLKMSDEEIRHIRGAQISMVFQDPMTSFNPVLTIGRQVAEPLEIHMGMSRKQALERAAEMLAMVGIPNAKERLNDYPHQFSGGMRQRVTIALATILWPRLIFVDEPTTALDVVVQRGVIQLLKDVQEREGSTIVLITHDLGVHANLAERIAVLYAGQIVEEADARTILKNPRHPYTHYLIHSLPDLDERVERESIPGRPPALDNPPSGCRFHPRCPLAMEKCKSLEPQMVYLNSNHRVACHLVTEEIGLVHDAEKR